MCVLTVDLAVESAHRSIMFNTGQKCAAGSRTYVHESIYDEFVRRSVDRAKKRTTGDPFKAQNENGPQVTSQKWALFAAERSSIKDDRTEGDWVWPNGT